MDFFFCLSFFVCPLGLAFQSHGMYVNQSSLQTEGNRRAFLTAKNGGPVFNEWLRIQPLKLADL